MSLTIELTDREVDIVRMALRSAEDAHKRNDFKVLVLEVQDLRSKLNDAIIHSVMTTTV